MTFEARKHRDGSVSFTEAGYRFPKGWRRSRLLYTVNAQSWEDAMDEHHKRMGWEPYRSMNDDEKEER